MIGLMYFNVQMIEFYCFKQHSIPITHLTDQTTIRHDVNSIHNILNNSILSIFDMNMQQNLLIRYI